MTTKTEDAIAVVVVDDSKEFMKAACAWLENHAGTRVAGTAKDGIEAIEAVARLGPDLVLIDAFMPVMGGLAATRAIKGDPGAPQVIVLSVHESRHLEREALAAGADAFLPKSMFASRLPALLRQLFGDRYPAGAAQAPDRPRALRRAESVEIED